MSELDNIEHACACEGSCACRDEDPVTHGSAMPAGERKQLVRLALVLAAITVGYNILEGLVSVAFGLADDTLALFGFGLDSFVEVISGIGVLHLTLRIRANDHRNEDRFERLALRITAGAFFLLAAGLAVNIVYNLATGQRPTTTFWGIVVSLVSVCTMFVLLRAKLSVGRRLGSKAIIADAACTKTCIILSFVLLASSLAYALWGLPWIDSLGALGVIVFAIKEGREAWGESNGQACSCGLD